ncbi:uncharacterized protein [Dermacentor andersoni]|uniref:uncharacterized protein n=1 Tax=Dermacentor andersoni TaxID=34620 RepID=UPI0021555B53|nr:uncharacterized protein LOC126544703 [Dermacentor andersoni]
MQYIAVAVATVCVVVVSGYRNCTESGGCDSQPECSELEEPVFGSPRLDSFCRPLFTPHSEREKLRTCVCKHGYVRNSWDECVPRKDCMRCKFRWQTDFRTCASGCPATCNRADDIVCQIPCAPGCECPPGWKQHPVFVRMCIRDDKCPRKCRRHSSLQQCVSSCAPQCGKPRPLKCVTSCGTPSCVCDKGYAELLRAGVKSCVRQERCPKLISLTRLFTPMRRDHAIDRETSFGTGGYLATSAGARREPSPWFSAAGLVGPGEAVGRRPRSSSISELPGEGAYDTGTPELSPLFEESRVSVSYNEAPVEHYRRVPPNSGAFAWRETARYGGVGVGFYPWSALLRNPTGLGRIAIRVYPWTTTPRVTAGYVLNGYGVDPLVTPLGFAEGYGKASSVYYPWGTPLRGTIGYGWAGYGIYPWGTPLLVTPIYGGSALGFHPWRRLSSGVTRYDGSGVRLLG